MTSKAWPWAPKTRFAKTIYVGKKHGVLNVTFISGGVFVLSINPVGEGEMIVKGGTTHWVF